MLLVVFRWWCVSWCNTGLNKISVPCLIKYAKARSPRVASLAWPPQHTKRTCVTARSWRPLEEAPCRKLLPPTSAISLSHASLLGHLRLELIPRNAVSHFHNLLDLPGFLASLLRNDGVCAPHGHDRLVIFHFRMHDRVVEVVLHRRDVEFRGDLVLDVFCLRHKEQLGCASLSTILSRRSASLTSRACACQPW